MSLTVKVYLEKSRLGGKEIRRFSGPADVSINYDYLYRRISDIFPSLRHGSFSLYWKNSDGDLVALSTNDELLEALGFVKDSLLKIYVHEKASNVGSEDAMAQLHPGVKCDGCDEDIIGNLFKCMECPDYDLCSNCEKIGIHKEHDMMRITSPMETECCAESLTGHLNLGFPSKSHEPELHGTFVVPQYFCRWMQKFTRRWISRNGPGRSTENVTKETKIQNVEKPKNLETEQKEGGANVEEVYVKHVVKKFDKSSMWELIDINDTIYVDPEGRYVSCSKSDNRSSGNLMGAKSMETEPPSSPMITVYHQPEPVSPSSSKDNTMRNVNSAISKETESQSSPTSTAKAK